MRKIAILLTAAFALLLVGMLGFQADATVGTGAHSLPLVAKDYSPVEKDRLPVHRGVRGGTDFGVPPVLALLVRPLPLAVSKRREISLAARPGAAFIFTRRRLRTYCEHRTKRVQWRHTA